MQTILKFWSSLRHQGSWIGRAIALVGCLWLSCSAAVQAGPLSDRLAHFPQWQDKPPVQMAQGDLVYPAWFEGEWTVTSTLVDLVAPLAPDLITPGFESSRQRLNQPIAFQVRFLHSDPATVVADRSFNGLNLARASLGDRTVQVVKTDPRNPNRQLTLLRGDRQLISTVKGRAVETPGADQFITTELFQQIFRGTTQPYVNEVESTTAYQFEILDRQITADQVTAIYLSPQDPDYFKAGNRPVALYRYRLKLAPADPAKSPGLNSKSRE